MPIALVAGGPWRRRVPLVADPFRLGRDPEAELVIEDERAATRHAQVNYTKGEYVLGGRSGETVFVNGKRVPFMTLRHGDEIHLVDPALGDASALRFENRLSGAFVPPGESLAAAWMAHPAFRDPAYGPDRFGAGQPLGGRNPDCCWIVREADSGRRLVVKLLGPVRSPGEGDHHLSLLSALAGAPHPGLVPVVDGGLAPGAQGPVRWMACAWVEGECVRDRLTAEGALPPPLALRILRELAGALTHAHMRGVLHRDVSPANIVVTPVGHAVLIDPGQALLLGRKRAPAHGVVGTPGYLAPEAVLTGESALSPAADVYGLAAVGYALLTGRPPAAGADVLEALAQAATPPPRPSELGVSLPPPLESTLLDALAPEPRARPTARQFERSLAFAQASLGLGGGECE